MKWIKASERLPENGHLIISRFIHTKIPIEDLYLFIGFSKEKRDLIEWLDESEPSFTLEDMKEAWLNGFDRGDTMSDVTIDEYFKTKFNITL